MTLTRLQSADEQIEELKEQLDDALGAEEMLVQLTERNLMLGEVSSSTQTQSSEGSFGTNFAENRRHEN